MTKNIEIAVIDSGVNEIVLKDKLANKIFINQNLVCQFDDIECIDTEHGTICSLIIKKYFKDCKISSVRILDPNGLGLIEKLGLALEWCVQNDVRLVNLSLGTTYFNKMKEIRKLVNKYANLGLIIVAASSNEGVVTYPSSFSNVIGVATFNNKIYGNKNCIHLGIDVLAASEHELLVCDSSIFSQKSNSYATPYVSAIIGEILCDAKHLSMTKIKKILYQKYSENIKVMLNGNLPDWINKAYVSVHHKRSKAEYYFDTVSGDIENICKEIDTVIIDSTEDIDKILNYEKNIVYLGKEKLEIFTDKVFFWSSFNREKQILNSDGEAGNLEIPVIICVFAECMDEIALLLKMRDEFSKDDYNIYTVSFENESVLYDLEYIPERVLDKGMEKCFRHFIYQQTYYKNSDGILYGVKTIPHYDYDCNIIIQDADLIIRFEISELGYQIYVCGEGSILWMKIFQEIDDCAIRKIYKKIKRILLGEMDE